MRRCKRLLATSILLLTTACQQGAQDANRLNQIQRTHDPRIAAQTPVTCTDVSAVCARLYQEQGGACLDLTESADSATRAAMRSCAVNDFRQAIAHSPPTSDQLLATRGLAEAVRISRDNAASPAADITELDTLALQLQTMPGGAAYSAYYTANNDLFRVLTKKVPANQTCATLKNAQVRLPGGGAPQDLNQRLADLHKNLTVAIVDRSCG
jgi:hypothetical protein